MAGNIQVFYRMFIQMYRMRLLNENGVIGAEMMECKLQTCTNNDHTLSFTSLRRKGTKPD